MSEMAIAAVTLEGRYVRLEPLTSAHTTGLAEVGLDEDLWKWIPAPVRTLEEMSTYVQTALLEQANGSALPFAAAAPLGPRVMATSSALTIAWKSAGHGWQSSGSAARSTRKRNTSCYDTPLKRCIRVELKTDSLNECSRAAILRIGAREEGTFRNHVITASGRIRHTVYFSILDSEWPEVKTRLEYKLR